MKGRRLSLLLFQESPGIMDEYTLQAYGDILAMAFVRLKSLFGKTYDC